jgi:hypothetical protein
VNELVAAGEAMIHQHAAEIARFLGAAQPTVAMRRR